MTKKPIRIIGIQIDLGQNQRGDHSLAIGTIGGVTDREPAVR